MSTYTPTARFPELLAELLGAMRARLRAPTNALFDAIDNELFALAESASNSDRQQVYFEAMRECRRHRSQSMVAFIGAIEAHVEAVAPKPAPANPALSLIEHETLEVELAVGAMAARANQRMGDAMSALNQRLALLLDVGIADDAHNPLGPHALAAAFAQVLNTLDLALEVRLIALRLFDNHVLATLEPIYADINKRLIDAGVLVQLPAPTRTEHPRADSAPPAAAEQSQVPSADTSRAGAGGFAEMDTLSSLLSLLEQRMQSSVSAASAHSESASASALNQALARFLERVDQGHALPSPRQFASQLLAEARYAEGGATATPAHAASIDLVGRVFDALLRNAQLPKATHSLFAPLQVPITRAVLEDPSALAIEARHPLRQAIDLLAEVTKGWCVSADPEREALGQLQAMIDAITHAQERERQQAAVQALKRTLDAHNRRAELSEQRAVEAASGREQLASARKRVHQVVAARLNRTPAPPWVSHLVSRPWANYLVLVLLRHGETSAHYREAVGFADILVWCTVAGEAQVERLRLRALVPVLETQLRSGLASVAYHTAEIDQLCDELGQFMRWRLGEIERPAFVDREVIAPQDIVVPDLQAAISEDQPVAEALDAALLYRIRSLQPGAWFEFGAADDPAADRAKLSWISPASGRCLFVNRNGLSVGEKRPEHLVEVLQHGLARILEDANVMQQTLAALQKQLLASATPAPPAESGRPTR
ncbi:MAG: hypothetical protein COW59_09000 [Lysobacterales bacterium CG17_big_fil_post_rev_8_21_14_2_50_64_11]|nr:MAG: hypothetical protein COW59_09000 [Xanthomonadales bacterium CG17_big_fil_post_rev_8_21_14_2_50_64_11]